MKSKTLLNGKSILYWAASICSGFIDLVFISNLTKTDYEIGSVLSLKAAVFLSLWSIVLTGVKAVHVQQIKTIEEIERNLDDDFSKKNFMIVKRRWKVIYRLYVFLSIFTSMSLSTVSIGSGITRNANTLKQIDTFIEQGTRYSELVNTANNTQLTTIVKKAADTSEEDGIRKTAEWMNEIRPLVDEWKDDRAEFEAQFDGPIDWNSEWKGKNADDYWNKANEKVNIALQRAGYPKATGQQLKNLNLATVEQTIYANYLKTHKAKSSDEVNKQMGELKDSTLEEAAAWIETLNSIGFVKNVKVSYVTESGKDKSKWTTIPVVFDTDPSKSTKVLVDTALTQLKAFRVDVENDSGDIGSSSKIFMQIGSAIDALKRTNKDLDEIVSSKATSGSFGFTEISMMAMLFFLSLLVELAINQLAPKMIITEKLLWEFSQYFSADFSIAAFMLKVIKSQRDHKFITQEEYLALKSEYDERIKEEQIEAGIIVQEPEFSSEVDDKINEIKELLND